MEAPLRAARWRRRSLRFTGVIAVIAVILWPLVYVWSAKLLDSPTIWLVRGELRAARDRVVAGADPAEIARERGVRVRVLAPDGTVQADEDRIDVSPWGHALSDPLFGPEGRPDPREYDAELGPLADRAEVREAARAGTGQECSLSSRGLVLCGAAARLPDGRIVHVSEASTRLQSALYQDRFQLTALALLGGAFGTLVALWLGRRIVGPIRQLQEQVGARIAGGSLEPVELDRPDELGDLAAAFNRLLRTIDDRNRANEAFAADLAHELKNPVAAVRAAAEALGRETADPARTERLARALDDSGRRMDLVISRFLELARAEAGLVTDAREPVELHELVVALVERFRADPAAEGTIYEVAAEPASVPGSAERIETALRNLLSNATAFSGGRVDVAVRREEGFARVSVTDHGPGIAAEDLPKVFERYWSTRAGGTGIGLALARAIAVAHAGTLTVESTPGEGSTFTLRLPE